MFQIKSAWPPENKATQEDSFSLLLVGITQSCLIIVYELVLLSLCLRSSYPRIRFCEAALCAGRNWEESFRSAPWGAGDVGWESKILGRVTQESDSVKQVCVQEGTGKNPSDQPHGEQGVRGGKARSCEGRR